MAFAAANSVSLRISKEATWGEDPATPTMQELKFTGESLSHLKDTVQSNTIRSDRMRDDLLQVGVGAEGDINIELAYSDYDSLLEGLLGGTFSPITTGAQSITIAMPAKTFTRSAGSFITDGFKVGQWVHPTGFTTANKNNGFYLITTLTATVMTVADPDNTLAAEVGTGDEVIEGNMLRNGGTVPSFLIEKAFTDISKFIYFTGCMVNQLQLSVTAKEVVTGVFGFLGKRGFSSATTISGSVTAAGTKTPLTASSNVGHILKDDVAMTSYIRSLQVTAANNLRAQDAVGNLAHIGCTPGFFEARGSLEFFLDDLTMYQAMENHTPFKISMRFTDPAGNIIILTLPKVYLGRTNTNATGGNTDVMVNCEMEAVRDTTTNCLLQIDLFDAA